MTGSNAELRHQIDGAIELQSVVRSMRALAASSIHQYLQSVLALSDYRRAVHLGLSACLRLTQARTEPSLAAKPPTAACLGAIVFGSDQGLVGQFNEAVADCALKTLKALPGKHLVWAVGERVRARLEEADIAVAGVYAVPNSTRAIAEFVTRLQIDTTSHPALTASPHIHVFHNRPMPGALYEPVHQRLLPLDAQWRADLAKQIWPTPLHPEVLGHYASTLRALVREHLFISLFGACAESLASENASRLAAMERADENINDRLASLNGKFRSQRQSAIDEELFDVIAGYQALTG